MNTKLHAVANANGHPLSFFMMAAQVSDYTGAAALIDDMLKAQWLLSNCGYDAEWLRDGIQAESIRPRIPSRRSRNEPVGTTGAATGVAAASNDVQPPQEPVPGRHPIRPLPTSFFSAVAATVIFWL